jgi:hypothetical protein
VLLYIKNLLYYGVKQSFKEKQNNILNDVRIKVNKRRKHLNPEDILSSQWMNSIN